MKRIRNLFYLSLFLTVPGLQAVAQEKLHVSLPDSITELLDMPQAFARTFQDL